ncbi:hypothetical protein TraAM80_09440 [Trypanosoma rangeli]|uniref:CSD domain-containing protein n=1 Tax=Trypanosoma rangeli TaxID=5698 RepID=A0A3R7R786_TRYRA|nr:uncharacterized protein TraAM80_09440 [Trypanosoma rangeli]RNE97194.1 hypothetical protein TraAM80_09440 [Trypanosoma rangeli]|eukprot:RNE97194.1 hypothetical protein TraAM80_09440 [Trypanosoma rangeli]
MFRLVGWRLTAIVTSTPLLQKAMTAGKTPQGPVADQPAKRRIGTVTSFMHRRGYGFLREVEPPAAKKKDPRKAAAAIPANTDSPGSDVASTFFFPRSSLDGGFYLTEGQIVAFDVRVAQPSKKLNTRLTEANSAFSADAALASASADSSDETVNGERSRQLSVAHRIRLYDALDGKEKSVTPIMLFGYVDSWDPLAGTGVIAELDLCGSLHDDAPRFTVSLEDLDLAAGSELRRGRYVRFCLEAGDRTAARRVIVDRSAEKKHAVRSEAATGDTAGAPESRFYGTVREIVEGRFGFILLDGTGESVFFHLSNAEGDGVKQGDTVSFIMREVTQGKHAGKRTCVRVRRCTGRSSKMPAGASANGRQSRAASDPFDEDDFELLD